MNYYPHNIGDFAVLTQGLDLESVGIMIRLIDRIMSTEKPIKTQWVNLGFPKESQEKVMGVLAGFFDESEEGWMLPMLEESLDKYQKNRLKNQENGKKGGRPKKVDASVSVAAQSEKPSGLFSETQMKPSEKATNNQEPITNIYTTLPNGSVSAEGSTAAERSEPVEISPLSPVQKVASRCPHEKLIDLYHQEMPNNPIVRSWNSAKRRASSQARWKLVVTEEKIDTEAAALDWFRSFFRFCNASAFLRGQGAPDRNGRTFVPDLEWILTAGNFDKIIDRRYHD